MDDLALKVEDEPRQPAQAFGTLPSGTVFRALEGDQQGLWLLKGFRALRVSEPGEEITDYGVHLTSGAIEPMRAGVLCAVYPDAVLLPWGRKS